jgi:hypothetical protein
VVGHGALDRGLVAGHMGFERRSGFGEGIVHVFASPSVFGGRSLPQERDAAYLKGSWPQFIRL